MKNLNRFLVLAAALWVTAGAANAQEKVLNGTFTSSASLFKNTFGLIGYTGNPSAIPNWGRGGTGTLYSGVEGAATALSPKNTFGPTDYGGRTFGIIQGSTGSSYLYQQISLPAGSYRIQYDVARQGGQPALTYQVVVQYGSTFQYIRSGTANDAAFETVTDYFAGGGTGTNTTTIYLQNYRTAAYASFSNISIQAGTPPAPTVSNNTPINQGETVTLTASSPYTTDPNAFNWNGPVLTNYKGNNLSFANAQPGWSGTYTCTVTVNGAISAAASTVVTVNALPTTFAITASSGSNGTVSPDGVTNVNSGGSQTYTITPATGYYIDQVLVDGVNNPGAVSSGSYTFSSVTATHTIAASFAINTYNISSSAGDNGSISPSGSTSVNYNGSQGYTITPATGYHVADVLVDGGSVGAVTSYTFSSVTATHTIIASFAINTYNITSSAGDNGSISPNGSTSVNYNGSQTFIITPDTGYALATLTVDGIPDDLATNYMFMSVTTTHSITATFAPIPTTITVTQTDHGTISPGTTTPTYGENQPFSITPATGYAVATLTVDGSSVTPATSYTFTNVTTTHTITATFHTLYQAWLAANSKPDNEASLKEYAFGTTNTGAISVIDSTHITLGQTPAMQIAGTAVTTVFGRRQNYQAAGLTYTVSFSADLTNWYPSTDTDNLTYAGTPDLNNPAVIASQGDMNAVNIPFPLFIKTAKGYEKTQAFCIIKVIIN